MATTKRKSLPKRMKPSALIRVALKDLTQVERMKRTYVIDMGSWHKANGKCAICFAGAVMAGSLGAKPTERLDPTDFDTATGRKLEALDSFRNGWVRSGLVEMGLKSWTDDLPEGLETPFDVPEYQYDRPGFKRAMRSLATKLERVGL